MAGQHALEQFHRPLLQSLRHQRVVGVTTDRLRDLPGFVPLHAMLVDERAQKFRHRQRGVSVVQLDGDFRRQLGGIGFRR